MSMLVRMLQPSDHPAWDDFVLRHRFGTPFHLIAWKQSIEQTFRYRPLYLLAGDGERIEGVLPLFLVQTILTGKVLLSTPFAVYGGVLAESENAARALADEAQRLARDFAVEYLELRNAWPEQKAGFEPVSRYVTFTQEIGPDEEAILAAIPRKTRYMVRKALKHPFATRCASAAPGGFIDLYARNLRRLGTPSFPVKHFTNLLGNFGERVDIREVTLEGKLVAAVMSFYFRDWILPYYGASDPAFNEFAPNNYMYFDLMRWGGQNGYRLFDFGRSKTQGSGSFDFKAHWGMRMRELPYEMWLGRRKRLPDFTPNNPRYQLAIRAWQHLPFPVTRAIGPIFLRWVP